MVRKRDQTLGPIRRTAPDKGGGRSLQALLVTSGPLLRAIHQPSAPRDPRTLAMVQGATRDFEPIPQQKVDNYPSRF